MIQHVKDSPKPYHLYTKDGSRLLGKHETKAQAEAQETAINIRKHASVSRPRTTALPPKELQRLRQRLAEIKQMLDAESLEYFLMAQNPDTSAGASIYSARTPQAHARTLRNFHAQWESSQGIDANHDWGNDSYMQKQGGTTKPLLQTLLGTPYANTATNPILRTPWARNHEIYSRVLGALSGGFYGGAEALTTGVSGRVFDESIADYLATQDPLPRALLTAAMVGGGAMLGSRVGGAMSATKHLTLEALRPMLRENSDFLGLLDTARDFSV